MARTDDHLEKRFEERVRSGAMCSAVEISKQGLIFGASTILIRMTQDQFGSSGLAVDDDKDRMLALLSVVYKRVVPDGVLLPFKAASDDWHQGDKALANIRLAQAHLPRLSHASDAYRLFLAETLLDQGMAPAALMKELGLDPAATDAVKYDPDQLRVPAGSGRNSGQWGPGSGSGRSATTNESTRAFLTPAAGVTARSFLAGAAPSTIEALAAFASRFSVPTAVLGALFIPTPNSGGVTEGTLPDATDVRFKQDSPAGTLRLTAKAADGSNILVSAQNHGGLYVDVRTGEPIGRNLDGQLYLDIDAVQDAIRAGLAAGREYAPKAGSESDNHNPKLCPAPEPDTPHGSSERAKDYEDDVHARVNPLAPLPRGIGVNLTDPSTGRQVYYEDCFRYAGDLVDGDMQKGDLAEAKGPGYEWRIQAGGKTREDAFDELLTQATKQLRTADASERGLKWYFAEPYVANEVREEFSNSDLKRIVVTAMPPRKRK